MNESDSQTAEDSGELDSSTPELPNSVRSDASTLAEPVQRIAEYQLIRKVGRGGMGEVYEALHVRLKKRVAVKLLPEGRVSEPGTLRRFFREMEAAGKLTHPHIVQATDAGEVDAVPYLVMEFVDGADLGHLVRQFGPLPTTAALEAVEQAALGLEHIHHLGLVHRDVKPSNLLMDRQGVVKVGDLGLAQLNQPPSQSDDLTSTDILLGTIDYMAPEQAESAKLVDHRADIYSLGCCLYFLLTGQTVFGSNARLDRLLAHRAQSPPPLSQHCPTPVPKSLERLFRRMLEKQPSQRPDSMRDVLTDLAACRQELQSRAEYQTGDLSGGPPRFPPTFGLRDVAQIVFSVSGRPAEPFVKRTVTGDPQWRRRRLRAFTLAGAGLAVLLVVGAIWHFRYPPPGPGEPGESNLETPPTLESAHTGSVYALEFSPDGELLFSAGADGAVRAWELSSGNLWGDFRDREMETMIDIAALPTSPRVVAASYSGRAYVWNWRDRRIERIFDEARGHVEGVAVAGGTRVVTSGVDDALYLWDAATGTVLAKLDNEHEGGVRALSVDPNGRFLMAGDYQGNLSLWDLTIEARIASLTIGSEMITVWSLDWAPDGSRIAIGGSIRGGEGESEATLLVIYDPFRQQVVRRLAGHSTRINAVRFSRDGRVLYSVAEDLRVWSLPDGEMLQHEVLPAGELFGLAESVDGAFLAVAGSDGTIYFVRTADSRSQLTPADAH
jgi:serine/threonine protein kinase